MSLACKGIHKYVTHKHAHKRTHTYTYTTKNKPQVETLWTDPRACAIKLLEPPGQGDLEAALKLNEQERSGWVCAWHPHVCHTHTHTIQNKETTRETQCG